MKRWFTAFLKVVEWAFMLLLAVSLVGAVLMVGSFFLNLFGVLNYGPPMHDTDNVVSIELVDTSRPEEKVVGVLTGNQMEAFLDEFLQIRFKRYANDPPEPYGDRMVRITCSDGYVDCIGEEMNQRIGPSGQWVSAKGWYYCPGNEIEILFEKYTDRSDK